MLVITACDTETTGLFWQHGASTFSVGLLSTQDKFQYSRWVIDPTTRKRWSDLPVRGVDIPTLRNHIRSQLRNPEHRFLFQNARFDIKALCELGVFSWEEPLEPSFWDGILDLKHLTHLHDSCDAEFGASLKKLSPKYLGEDYESKDDLESLTHSCRRVVEKYSKPWKSGKGKKAIKKPALFRGWRIASEDDPATCPGTDKFHMADYWLPGVFEHLLTNPLFRHHFGITEEDIREILTISFKSLTPFLPPEKGTLSAVDSYLKDDCSFTLSLGQNFLSILAERHGESLDDLLWMNQQIQPVLWDMELNGVPVSKQRLSSSLRTCEEWKTRLHQRCIEDNPIPDLGSETKFTDTEIRNILFSDEGFGLLPEKEGKTGPSVDAATIISLKEQADCAWCQNTGCPNCSEKDNAVARFLGSLLAWRKHTKKSEYMTSYLKKTLPRNRSCIPCRDRLAAPTHLYLYPSFDESQTSTTRLSSRSPNAQNITKAMNPFEKSFPDVAEALRESPSVRAVFGPPAGYDWWSFDYSQLQLRIFAVASGEDSLIQAFEDGWDAHDYMAHRIFRVPDGVKPEDGQRRVAKAVNFGFIFGASESKIDATAGRTGLYQDVLEMFPNAHRFIESTKKYIRKHGYVKTLAGYPLQIPVKENPWRPGTYGQAAHAGVNYIVQGTEGEIVKKGLADCYLFLRQFCPGGRAVLQVHDENVFQLPKDTPSDIVLGLKSIMESAGSIAGVNTPVDVKKHTVHWGAHVPHNLSI